MMICLLTATQVAAQCTSGDCQSGQGVFLFSNQDQYAGEFTNGMPHGSGALTMADGTAIKGKFLNGAYSGSGEIQFTDQTVYTGQFFNGLPNGYGKKTLSNGDSFEGQWRNGKFYQGRGP